MYIPEAIEELFDNEKFSLKKLDIISLLAIITDLKVIYFKVSSAIWMTNCNNLQQKIITFTIIINDENLYIKLNFYLFWFAR